MHITSTNYTVADYCQAMKRKEIVVNRAYQRSDRAWPAVARSFLIETILLNYPIPKFFLFPKTDLKSKKTYREIVDGQQRSRAIFDFYNDQFPLSHSSEIPEAAGRCYSELADEHQQAFLDYALSVDLFVAATPIDIREVFRRINAYTVPLNPEEKRHSIYQGAFKWFIYNLSKAYGQNLNDIGVFTEKQLIRMADAKLFTELTHAVLKGITKTNARSLDALYKDYNSEFPEQQEMERRISNAINFVISLEDIHQSALMKSYNFYTLMLAISHLESPVESLTSLYRRSTDYAYNRDCVVANLTTLAEVLDTDTSYDKFYFDDPFKSFVSATVSDTNGAQNRQTRFKWFCKALEPKLL